MELAWDLVRTISDQAECGITTSYIDQMCQRFYEKDGLIYTEIGFLNEGHWETVAFEETQIVSEADYSLLDIDHGFNGYVMVAGQHGSDIVFMMYEYLLDVSNWLVSGTWQLQPDNPIKAGSITLANSDMSRYEDSAYMMFSPGNRLMLQFRSGDSDAYSLGMFYIESSPYSDFSDNFTFRGRNAIGFHLTSQTFDERVSYSGTRTSVLKQMLLDAGIHHSQMIVQDDASEFTITFSDSQKYLDGLQTAVERLDWYFDDLPDGRIVVGNEAFVKSNVAITGIYSFDRGSQVISREVIREVAGVFSRVCVRRKGETPFSLYADIPYYDGWHIAAHRTHYEDVPDDISQTDMERIRDQLVEELQYCGIIEKFVSPIRPWLQVGDVAVVTGGSSPRIVGIITDIQHVFGLDGFFTHFSVTGGGKISNPDNPVTVATRYTGKLGAANRKRRLLDYIQISKVK